LSKGTKPQQLSHLELHLPFGLSPSELLQAELVPHRDGLIIISGPDAKYHLGIFLSSNILMERIMGWTELILT